MTRIIRDEQRCAICGETNAYGVIASTNAFGASDLDLRPPEMQRSTMPYWVQECPKCGYVAKSVADETNVDSEFLNSQGYRSCDGIEFKSALATRFYKHYLISHHDGANETAFNALLHAAWACDDSSDDDNALRCRLLSLPLLLGLIDEESDYRETLLLVKADILRRAGRFDELLTEYASVSFSDDLINAILAFQLSLAEKKDSSCYRVSDVPE